ncbi:hypothetical protein [Paraburkholderia sp. 31.1]|nr:hypothetical protein [Paraburkholderia sp. 31.1]
MSSLARRGEYNGLIAGLRSTGVAPCGTPDALHVRHALLLYSSQPTISRL